MRLGDLLGAEERGAVWPCVPREALPAYGGQLLDEHPVPHEEIRSALIFFDRFDVPKQTMQVPEWCVAEFAAVGVYTPSFCRVLGEQLTALRDAPFETFIARERREPGRWTLARPAQAVGIDDRYLTPETGVALTFHNALPVFSRDVALDDVLEFKRRSWAELLALRQYLDELCLEVGRNGVGGLEHRTVYQRFTNALKDHIDLMGQSNRSKVWQSFKASCDVPSGAAGAAEYWYTGQLDMKAALATAATIGIRTIAGLRRNRAGTSPFEYLTSAHLDL